jgi:SAM-dependent methyltransferase
MKRLFLFACLLISVACNNKGGRDTPDTVENPAISKPTRPETVQPIFDMEIEEDRTDWQNPEIVLKAFGDLTNKTIADIGAGAGYFSFKLARQAGKVIALDIDPNALEYINEQKEIVGNWAENIETRLTPPDVPNLLLNEADAVLVVNTFSFIPQPDNYFNRLREGMKPNGELLVVDFKKGKIPVGPSDDRKMEASEIRSILRRAGFRRISIDQKSLEYQYIIKAIN